MKGILKRLSIAAAVLVLCAGLSSCGQNSQTGSSGAEAQTGQAVSEGQTGAEAQTASGNPEAQAATEGTKLVILHTNDMHGYLQA